MQYILPLVVLLAQVADIVTTNLALSVEGTREGNKVVRAIMDKLGKLWWTPKAVVGVVGAWLAFHNSEHVLAVVALGGMSLFTLYIALGNYEIYKKRK